MSLSLPIDMIEIDKLYQENNLSELVKILENLTYKKNTALSRLDHIKRDKQMYLQRHEGKFHNWD